MRISGPFHLKRMASDSADAIILTFSQRWEELLTRGQVNIVFRKQGPKDFTPCLLYGYVAAPTSAIMCRAPVLSYETVRVGKALELAARGCITPNELESYAGLANSLIVFELGAISVARAPITQAYLSQHYNYWPSSTFIPLSRTGVTVLNELGDFSEPARRETNDK